MASPFVGNAPCWHLRDTLINHPINLAFVSKLNSLCRMTFEREMAALRAIDQIERGEAVEVEVIPL